MKTALAARAVLLISLTSLRAQAHPQPPRDVCAEWEPAQRPAFCRAGDTQVVAAEAPRPPPPPPPPAPVPWTNSPSPMPWTVSVGLGLAMTASSDVVAIGFQLHVGFRRMVNFVPPPSASGVLLGNELGLDLIGRVQWILGGPQEELLLTTGLRPVLRVLTARSAISVPSVLGLLVPEVGVTQFITSRVPMRPELARRREGLSLRWSAGMRVALARGALDVFLEVEPALQLLVPFSGDPAQISFGAGASLLMLPTGR